MDTLSDTIVALCTPQGTGALAIIRVSGRHTFPIVQKLVPSKNIEKAASHTLHFCSLEWQGESLDEVVLSIFKGPRSFTREDIVEISCHGSPFIVQKIIQALVKAGARPAKPGEFTQRAFLNGRFDLVQAEAVADLIAAESEIMHQAALRQMRGGFSGKLSQLREKLIQFASLIELELDFSEEDVEFANREELLTTLHHILGVIRPLVEGFEKGNAVRNGIPVVLAGKPNAGKSTLLNALVQEEKAIVTDIPGTTRDVIEDVIHLNGVLIRFTDTAGIRVTHDKVEAIGVAKSLQKIKDAALLVYLFDLQTETPEEIRKQILFVQEQGVPYLLIGNKKDAAQEENKTTVERAGGLTLSAHDESDIHHLQIQISQKLQLEALSADATLVTNVRHAHALQKTEEALLQVIDGMKTGQTKDFIALDIRNALFQLGQITGEISTDDLLDNIFSKFCIGK